MILFKKNAAGILLLIAAAALGVALIYLPGWILDRYARISEWSPAAGKIYLATVAVGALLLLGSMLYGWWKLWGASLAKKIRRERRNRNPSELTSGQKAAEIEENLDLLESLRQQAATDPRLQAELEPLLQDLNAKRTAQTLEIVAFGTISSGKSSVLNLLAGREVFATDIRGGTTTSRNEIPWGEFDKVILVDTPGLGEVDGEAHVLVAAESAKDADVIILVVDGPLRESEFRLLAKLGGMEKRLIICLNKSDWYSEEDREKLLGQLRRQALKFVSEQDVVAIQAQIGERLRRRILPDGSEREERLEIPTEIGPLAERMGDIVREEGKELLLANLLLQSRGLLDKAKQRVKDSVDRRAWEVVDRYTCLSGGLAAINPVPDADVMAGMGVSTKMILELADVYQQKLDLDSAKKWLGQMGKVMLGSLGVQGPSVALGALTASLLKTVPFAGQFAGGMLQGVVQALITKWVGSVFIEYFRNEMQLPEGGLAALARRQWEQLTTADELRKLIATAREKLAQKEPA
ncbi:MAG: YcjF family protein [Planctomycetota bacterium]